MSKRRNWKRYALALEMHLEGHTLQHVADRFGISRERARQMVAEAKAQLAYRVFHIARPHFEHHKERVERGLMLTLLVLDVVEDALLLRDLHSIPEP